MSYIQKTDKQFNRKLNHLQGMVGLANWNFSFPSTEETRIHTEKAHLIRSEATVKQTGSLIAALARFSFGLISKLSRPFVERQKNARELRELLALDDHILIDIGITRDDVLALASKSIRAAEIMEKRLERRVVKPTISNCYRQPSDDEIQKACQNDTPDMRKTA